MPRRTALLATSPHDPFFLELKGQILLEGGKPKEAIASLREATQRSGEAPMIAAMLGHALVATEDPKNFAEAKQILKVAVNRDNEDPFAWYQLGIIYDREGDQARASLATAERNNLQGNPKMALASARDGDEGHSARDSGLSSGAGHRHGVQRRAAKKDKKRPEERNRVSDTNAAPAKRGNARRGDRGRDHRLAADRRGSCSSPLPTMLSSRIVRPGTARRSPRSCSDAVDALRDAQYAPVLAANRAAIETPFGKLVEGRGQARRHAGRILRLRLPLLQGEQPGSRPADSGG